MTSAIQRSSRDATARLTVTTTSGSTTAKQCPGIELVIRPRRPDDDRQLACYGCAQVVETERLRQRLGIPCAAQLDVTFRINVAGTDREPLTQNADMLPWRPNMYDEPGAESLDTRWIASVRVGAMQRSLPLGCGRASRNVQKWFLETGIRLIEQTRDVASACARARGGRRATHRLAARLQLRGEHRDLSVREPERCTGSPGTLVANDWIRPNTRRWRSQLRQPAHVFI
jgi:hypothetical protein